MTGETYTAKEIQELTGLPYRLVHYFAISDLVCPSCWIVDDKDVFEKYSYDDMLKLKIIKRHLDEGMRLPVVRQRMRQVSKIATDIQVEEFRKELENLSPDTFEE